ncbi:DNA repair protein RecN [Desulfohalobium retbaense]|uniref:DNA repair protein RecN n=1 Tax=Desulfohalobium retbaense (strain ATCC 49708 / DSM 5692 / JCM 16813 / HR100) TaxID=485915 RepID=C8WZ48_DESRD|nr:AAA family ATPase [Desulfohalobium retbaense]ACV67323.1 SMC domain protein [Desulfohalobium retbaense DSM 5692]
MLELLRIRNLALIQDLEMEFDPGLNVLTGESGAGKSFILRALDFILGEKLQTNHVRPGADKAVVEAIFHLEGQEYVLRRELNSATGRSRVYINDDLSSQAKIRALRPSLIIHTSQHGQQQLLNPNFHTRLLDGDIPRELLGTKEDLLSRYKDILRRLEQLDQSTQDLDAKRELLEYQQQQIDQVGPERGEEEQLLERKTTLREQAASQQAVQNCLEILNGAGQPGALDLAGDLQRASQSLQSINEGLGEHAQHLQEWYEYLKELETELRSQPLPFDSTQELEGIEARLWELAQLQRRLNRNLDQICDLHEEIEATLSHRDQIGLERQQLERQSQEMHAELIQAVQEVNAAREHTASRLAEQLRQELVQLGFAEEIQIFFALHDHEVAPGIWEKRARLQWVPNPGQPVQALDEIASGGELSRFLLGLVCLQSTRELPTLLFDEVDAGVGGVTLNSVGQRLTELSRRQQVVLISHWPQLASRGQRHFQVAKEIVDGETFTTCHELDAQARFDELARMAGGDEQGLAFAQQLLHNQ